MRTLSAAGNHNCLCLRSSAARSIRKLVNIAYQKKLLDPLISRNTRDKDCKVVSIVPYWT